MLLKKMVVLALALAALLLVTAQLALAQQYAQPDQIEATHQDINNTGTQTTGGEQTAPPPDPAQQSGGSTTPSLGGSADQPSTGNNPNALMHLDENNELVVDCAAVDAALAQPQGQSTSTPSDLQSQAALTGLKELSQLCVDSGYTPANSGSTPSSSTNPSGAGSTPSTSQTQQNGSGGGAPSLSNPSGASFTPSSTQP